MADTTTTTNSTRTRRSYDDFAKCLDDNAVEKTPDGNTVKMWTPQNPQARYSAVSEFLGYLATAIRNAEDTLAKAVPDQGKAVSLQLELAGQLMSPEQRQELIKLLQAANKA